MNHDRSDQTIEVLGTMVTVPPRSAIQLSAESISERFAWSNWTLADSWDTVVPWGAGLEEAVPVKRGTLDLELVVDGHLDPITPVCFDLGSMSDLSVVLLVNSSRR